MPVAFEPLAIQRENELALFQPFMRVAIGHPGAVIPHDHRAPAILPFGDGAFPGEVIERMVLSLDGEALDPGHHADAFGDGPALEHAVELEPQIEMKAPRIMALNGEAPGLFLPDFRARLRRLRKIAFFAIGRQTPGRSLRRLFFGATGRHSL